MKFCGERFEHELYLIEPAFVRAMFVERNGHEEDFSCGKGVCRGYLFTQVIRKYCRRESRGVRGAVVLEGLYEVHDRAFAIVHECRDAYAEEVVRRGSERNIFERAAFGARRPRAERQYHVEHCLPDT